MFQVSRLKNTLYLCRLNEGSILKFPELYLYQETLEEDCRARCLKCWVKSNSKEGTFNQFSSNLTSILALILDFQKHMLSNIDNSQSLATKNIVVKNKTTFEYVPNVKIIIKHHTIIAWNFRYYSNNINHFIKYEKNKQSAMLLMQALEEGISFSKH